MPGSQRNEPFEEPPFEEISNISRMHVQGMEATNADEVWIGAGMKQLLLRTVGRKSGNEHKVALPYWEDANGDWIVVASYAGAKKHPAWYLNLTDRDANPQVYVKHQGGEFWTEPEVLDGDDYSSTWDALTADRDYYNKYQTRTDRKIPLVRLPVPSE